MASLTRLKARGAGGKPSWRIQFYDGAGDRRAVHLGTLPKKAAETWQSRVEQLNACAVAGVAIATDLAAWVASLPDVSHGKLSRVGLVEPRAAADKGLRVTCALLKVLGFAALALCLLEPFWTGQRVKPGANLLAVVADNSQGMQIHDRGNAQSRGEFLRDTLAGKGADWLAKLRENFEVRGYVFDSRLQPSTDFTELNFDGRASAIGSALTTLKERLGNRPIAGIVLLTDGNATDIAGELPDLKGLPPIYPVVIGREDADRDIALVNVGVTQTSFEDAPVTIQAEATASGYAGADVKAELLDRAGKVIEQQTVRVKGSSVLVMKSSVPHTAPASTRPCPSIILVAL